MTTTRQATSNTEGNGATTGYEAELWQIEELEDERRWDRSFAASQDKLAQLAQKVRTDIEGGRIHKMGFDEL